MRRTAIAVIDGIEYVYALVGRRGNWSWRCPDGQLAGDAAGGATKEAALENLRTTLDSDEPDFERLAWG